MAEPAKPACGLGFSSVGSGALRRAFGSKQSEQHVACHRSVASFLSSALQVYYVVTWKRCSQLCKERKAVCVPRCAVLW